jgi:hypothetical protein
MIHGPLVKKGLHSPRVQTTMKEKPARVYTKATCCGIFEPPCLIGCYIPSNEQGMSRPLSLANHISASRLLIWIFCLQQIFIFLAFSMYNTPAYRHILTIQSPYWCRKLHHVSDW